jgi:thiol-disulfide isomerase/thioredoxin
VMDVPLADSSILDTNVEDASGAQDAGADASAPPMDTPMGDTPPPGAMDSDKDGLPDDQEKALGSDPQNPDTDGDGYLDGHEVNEGKDPLDPESRIYHGNWPYNPDKDDVNGPGWEKCVEGQCIGKGSCNPADEGVDGSPWEAPTGCSLKNGLQLPRWSGTDQYGDTVDLYDFLGTGKPIVLDVGTPFCKPCKGLAAFFSTGDPNHTTVHAPDPLNSFAWWKPEYEVILDLINNDEIHWITIVWSSCVGGNPVDEAAGIAWHDEWPHPKIPVLVDPDCQLKDYLNVKAMPHIDVLDSDLVFTTYVTNGPTAAMKALSAL